LHPCGRRWTPLCGAEERDLRGLPGPPNLERLDAELLSQLVDGRAVEAGPPLRLAGRQRQKPPQLGVGHIGAPLDGAEDIEPPPLSLTALSGIAKRLAISGSGTRPSSARRTLALCGSRRAARTSRGRPSTRELRQRLPRVARALGSHLDVAHQGIGGAAPRKWSILSGQEVLPTPSSGAATRSLRRPAGCAPCFRRTP